MFFINSTSAWSSFRKSLFTAKPKTISQENERINQNQDLPQIPKGTFTGIWTLIRASGNLQADKSAKSSHANLTQTTELEMAPYSELRSVDMEYHHHLVSENKSSHKNSRVGTRDGSHG
jgi:hypothetical protein